MFELDQGQSWVEATPEEVVFIATSINRPSVAPPDRSPEPAQAYICTSRSGNLFYVYIYLYLVSSNAGLLYRWDAGGVPKDLVSTLEQNALEFSESMGFMMSDLRYREMSPEERTQLFESTPVFHQDLSRFKTEEEIQEIEPEDIGESELVIEPIEEPGAGTLTEGEFSFDEDSVNSQAEVSEPAPAAEAPPAGSPPVPDLTGEEVEEILLEGVEDVSKAPAAATAVDESVEDIILDGLEMREGEAEPAPSPSPPTPEPEGVASAEDEDILLDSLEEQDTAQVQEAQAAPPAETPVPDEDEIAIEGIIEEETPAEEATQEMDIPAAAIIPERAAPAAVPVTVPGQAASPTGPSQGDPASREDNLTGKDVDLLVRLLAMM